MATPNIQPDDPQKKFLGLGLLVVVLLAALLSRCTFPAPAGNVSEVNVLDNSATAETIVAPTPSTEPVIEEAVLAMATSHVGKALGADGIEGAKAYSVNCWAVVDRTFAFATADRCAAFDAMVLSQAVGTVDTDLDWFAEDAVGQRYTQAISRGEPRNVDASARLERVRLASAVRKITIVVPKARLEPFDDNDGGESPASTDEATGASNSLTE